MAHKDEYKMFGVFLSLHPKVNTKTWQDLSKQFLQKTNGTTIFPKLPCMLKAHYIQWTQNQLIRQAESKVQVAIAATLVQLTRPRTAPDPVPARAPVNNDVDGSVPAANFVGPLAAPHQTEFVEMTLVKSSKNRERKQCFYAPFCNMFADECGGFWSGKCSRVESGEVKLPGDEEFRDSKEALRKKCKAEGEMRRRNAKKKEE